MARPVSRSARRKGVLLERQRPDITVALLRAADPSNSPDYYAAIVAPMTAYTRAYAIDTPLRLAHFLVQIGAESAFRAVEENGNYAAPRMRMVFGCRGGFRRYDPATDDCQLDGGVPVRLRPKLWTEAERYAHQPEALLNYVYAQRLGNGDEASGDGYRYRGRGLIQLTGKDNYASFTAAHNRAVPADRQDFVAAPERLMESAYAVESAFYFWDANAINAAADRDDVKAVTQLVTGGENGLPEREARLANIKRFLGLA